MTWYTYLRDLYTHYKNRIEDFYSYIKCYFAGYHDIWIFMPGHSLPLSINNLNNTSQSPWIYDNNRCHLELNMKGEKDIVKFSWLSGKIRIITTESDHEGNKEFWEHDYPIDDFLEQFRVSTFMDVVPTLNTVFLSWCSYIKHWFPEDSIVEFMIITDEGEEQTLNILRDNECLEIKHNKIYVVVVSDDNSESADGIRGRANTENVIVSQPCSPELKPLDEVVKKKED